MGAGGRSTTLPRGSRTILDPAEFPELEGTGKGPRHLKVRYGHPVDEELVQDLVRYDNLATCVFREVDWCPIGATLFTRNIANRLWGHYFGRGVVEPVDDFRVTNPASNPIR